MISAVGIHHEAHMELVRGLSSFRAALPAGTTFTYSSAKPAIFARGALLTNVTLHTSAVTFRATQMRLGHPRTTPDGGIGINSLEIHNPSLQTASLLVHASSLSLHRLTLPPSHERHPGPVAIDPARTLLDHLLVEHLSVQNLSHTSDAMPVSPLAPVHMHSLTLNTFSVDNYGPSHLTTGTIQGATVAYTRMTQQSVSPSATQSGQLTFDHAQFQQQDFANYVGALKAHRELDESGLPPRQLDVRNLRVNGTGGTFWIDEITGNGTSDDGKSHFQQTWKGLHFRSMKPLPFRIDGQHSIFQATQDYSSVDQIAHIQGTLTIPALTQVIATADLHFQHGSAARAPLNTMRIANLAVRMEKGDRLLQRFFMFSARQAQNVVPADELRNQALRMLTPAVSHNAQLAPLPDYLLNPANRNLTLSYRPVVPVPARTLAFVLSQPLTFMAFLTSPDVRAVAE
ncbi:hypothetical protein GMO_23480 [Gluconobacter morbifer G707]|uniref:Uncharacterized protein n=1 Tax=Gluconobacter morbifer G707 TaxID=1088869 RepID=G6XLU9_9PROT|nr:hypothetical protein GMO_23480 [Gluconobacter morbifer G707]